MWPSEGDVRGIADPAARAAAFERMLASCHGAGGGGAGGDSNVGGAGTSLERLVCLSGVLRAWAGAAALTGPAAWVGAGTRDGAAERERAVIDRAAMRLHAACGGEVLGAPAAAAAAALDAGAEMCTRLLLAAPAAAAFDLRCIAPGVVSSACGARSFKGVWVLRGLSGGPAGTYSAS